MQCALRQVVNLQNRHQELISYRNTMDNDMADEVKIWGLTGQEMEAISAEYMPARIAEIMERMGFVSTVRDGAAGRLYKDGSFIPYEESQAQDTE